MINPLHSILVLFALLAAVATSLAEEQQTTANLNNSPFNEYETAVFAGGCFWCVESDFAKQKGIVGVVSGYTGGTGKNPTYKTYADQGHFEAVEVTYDPNLTSYEALLDVFWRHIDPTDAGGQFVDRGAEYRSAIVYLNQKQKDLAEKSKVALAGSDRFTKPLLTEILPFTQFYKAEKYHQDYAIKHPIKYRYYRYTSGRDRFLSRIWHTKTKVHAVSVPPSTDQSLRNREQIKNKLTPLQYKVTQKNGTEPPFNNMYWDNKEEGIYVDLVSGEPLFSSTDKYRSGTGWPSFTKPLEQQNIIEKKDRSFFTVRTEVRSKRGNSHLGHVFSDGPPPTGLRYCINSAALHFISRNALQSQGYEQYDMLFDLQNETKETMIKEKRPRPNN